MNECHVQVRRERVKPEKWYSTCTRMYIPLRPTATVSDSVDGSFPVSLELRVSYLHGSGR